MKEIRKFYFVKDKVVSIDMDGVHEEINDFIEYLEKRGYMITNTMAQTIYAVLMNGFDGVKGFFLMGVAGVGKTLLSKIISEYFGWEYIYFQATPQMDEDALYYRFVPSEETKSGFEMKDGKLIEALRKSNEKGVLLIIDEWDKTEPSMDSTLLDYIQNCRLLLADRSIQGNPENLRIIVISNAIRDFSEPLLRRLPLIELPPLTFEQARSLLIKKFGKKNQYIEPVMNLWVIVKEAHLSREVSIQEYMQLIEAMNKLEGRGNWGLLVFTYIAKNYNDFMKIKRSEEKLVSEGFQSSNLTYLTEEAEEYSLNLTPYIEPLVKYIQGKIDEIETQQQNKEEAEEDTKRLPMSELIEKVIENSEVLKELKESTGIENNKKIYTILKEGKLLQCIDKENIEEGVILGNKVIIEDHFVFSIEAPFKVDVDKIWDNILGKKDLFRKYENEFSSFYSRCEDRKKTIIKHKEKVIELKEEFDNKISKREKEERRLQKILEEIRSNIGYAEGALKGLKLEIEETIEDYNRSMGKEKGKYVEYDFSRVIDPNNIDLFFGEEKSKYLIDEDNLLEYLEKKHKSIIERSSFLVPLILYVGDQDYQDTHYLIQNILASGEIVLNDVPISRERLFDAYKTYIRTLNETLHELIKNNNRFRRFKDNENLFELGFVQKGKKQIYKINIERNEAIFILYDFEKEETRIFIKEPDILSNREIYEAIVKGIKKILDEDDLNRKIWSMSLIRRYSRNFKKYLDEIDKKIEEDLMEQKGIAEKEFAPIVEELKKQLNDIETIMNNGQETLGEETTATPSIETAVRSKELIEKSKKELIKKYRLKKEVAEKIATNGSLNNLKEKIEYLRNLISNQIQEILEEEIRSNRINHLKPKVMLNYLFSIDDIHMLIEDIQEDLSKDRRIELLVSEYLSKAQNILVIELNLFENILNLRNELLLLTLLNEGELIQKEIELWIKKIWKKVDKKLVLILNEFFREYLWKGFGLDKKKDVVIKWKIKEYYEKEEKYTYDKVNMIEKIYSYDNLFNLFPFSLLLRTTLGKNDKKDNGIYILTLKMFSENKIEGMTIRPKIDYVGYLGEYQYVGDINSPFAKPSLQNVLDIIIDMEKDKITSSDLIKEITEKGIITLKKDIAETMTEEQRIDAINRSLVNIIRDSKIDTLLFRLKGDHFSSYLDKIKGIILISHLKLLHYQFKEVERYDEEFRENHGEIISYFRLFRIIGQRFDYLNGSKLKWDSDVYDAVERYINQEYYGKSDDYIQKKYEELTYRVINEVNSLIKKVLKPIGDVELFALVSSYYFIKRCDVTFREYILEESNLNNFNIIEIFIEIMKRFYGLKENLMEELMKDYKKELEKFWKKGKQKVVRKKTTTKNTRKKTTRKKTASKTSKK